MIKLFSPSMLRFALLAFSGPLAYFGLYILPQFVDKSFKVPQFDANFIFSLISGLGVGAIIYTLRVRNSLVVGLSGPILGVPIYALISCIVVLFKGTEIFTNIFSLFCAIIGSLYFGLFTLFLPITISVVLLIIVCNNQINKKMHNRI